MFIVIASNLIVLVSRAVVVTKYVVQIWWYKLQKFIVVSVLEA